MIPVEFSNVSFSDKKNNVEEKVAKAEQYFNDQFSSYSNFRFDLLPTVKLSREQSWYGANSSTRKDERADQLVRDASSLTGKDLSAYNYIYIVAAGESEADGGGADCIWPQYIDGVAICAEGSSLGIFCHEFGHALGLQDLYDTDGNASGGTSKGVGGLSLMDETNLGSGDTLPCFCAIELEQLGIGSPVTLGYGAKTLQPVDISRQYLRIPGDTEGEYFLLECRNGSGLTVYHIDRSANDSGWSDLYLRNLSATERWQYNQVNCNPDHPCARVLQGYSLSCWSGAGAELAIDGANSNFDGSVSFNVITPISSLEINAFQDAAIISWTTDPGLHVRECQVSWQQEGAARYDISRVSRQAEGKYYIVLEKLSPATDYVTEIKVICENSVVHSRSASFSTKSVQKGVRPFIYLRLTGRNADGSFPSGERIPLRVYNAQDVESVHWYFDEEPISPDSDGFWHVSTSGTLKAKVWYNDGSSDKIIKRINVR